MGSRADADLGQTAAGVGSLAGIPMHNRMPTAHGRERSAGSAGTERRGVSRRAVGRALAVAVLVEAAATRAADGDSVRR